MQYNIINKIAFRTLNNGEKQSLLNCYFQSMILSLPYNLTPFQTLEDNSKIIKFIIEF